MVAMAARRLAFAQIRLLPPPPILPIGPRMEWCFTTSNNSLPAITMGCSLLSMDHGIARHMRKAAITSFFNPCKEIKPPENARSLPMALPVRPGPRAAPRIVPAAWLLDPTEHSMFPTMCTDGFTKLSITVARVEVVQRSLHARARQRRQARLHQRLPNRRKAHILMQAQLRRAFPFQREPRERWSHWVIASITAK